MEGPHVPHTQLVEGAYAIKVSMKIQLHLAAAYIALPSAHGPEKLEVTKKGSKHSPMWHTGSLELRQ